MIDPFLSPLGKFDDVLGVFSATREQLAIGSLLTSKLVIHGQNWSRLCICISHVFLGTLKSPATGHFYVMLSVCVLLLLCNQLLLCVSETAHSSQ